MVNTLGSTTVWRWIATFFTVVAAIVPEGAYQWAALSIAGVALVIGLTRIPRHVWARHKALLMVLGCTLAAIWVSVFFPVSAGFTTWTVGVTGVAFVGVVVFSATRLIRRRAKAVGQHHP
jgi:hypothetical protein